MCGERQAEYVATGTMMYAEQGIRMECRGGRPFVVRWFESADGKRDERSSVVDSAEWDRQWNDLNSSGWVQLDDCVNLAAGERDPVYRFSISDGRAEKSFLCQGATLPYPYDRIKTALDLAGRLVNR